MNSYLTTINSGLKIKMETVLILGKEWIIQASLTRVLIAL